MRIAQLSDLHLLEAGFDARSALSKMRARFLSVGRPVDRADRRARFVKGVQAAVAAGFDRLLLSGDLTEEGTESQFEEVANVLAEAKVDAARVTLLAGNHDRYHSEDAWRRAMDGPFRGSKEGSEPILADGVTLIPIDTTRMQHYVLSAGEIALEEWRRVRALVAARKGPVVLFMHHPPQLHRTPHMQWIDGLRNAHLVHDLLREFPNVHVMHGHTHRAVAQVWPGSSVPRVFSPQSVVTGDSPLRIYEVDARGLRAADDDLVDQ